MSNPQTIDRNLIAELTDLQGRDWSTGNQIVLLENGSEIFPAMLDAIDRAEKSVDLLTYIFWKGEIATRFAEKIAARSRAGVQCRVLLDAHGSLRAGRKLLDLMTNAGVQLAIYNPFQWSDPLRYQHRTHRKILVCDGDVGFIGGVGIADEWMGNAENPEQRHDYHFRAVGPCVDDLEKAFRENWESTWTRLRSEEKPVEAPTSSVASERSDPLPGLYSGVADDVRILPLLSSPSEADSEAEETFAALLDSAKKRVRIITAYLIPNEKIIHLLQRTTDRGVTIELIVPGPNRDSWLAHSRSRLAWNDILDCGVKMYLYQPTLCHSKLTVIDDCLATFGSINFDQLSFHLNEEANLIVHSKEFSKLMIEKFRTDRDCCVRLTKEQFAQRSTWEKAKELIADKFPLPYWKEGCDY